MTSTSSAAAGALDVAEQTEVGRSTVARVSARLLPPLIGLFLCNLIDRTNLAIAALQMNEDLHFSAAAYGLGAGILFVSYALFEIPSNLMLVRVGPRRWIARIAITWGLVASAMVFVRTPTQFYVMRLLLGAAEAGFLPGVVYYLSLWFPGRQRGTAIGSFMMAAPLAGIIGNGLGGWILGLDGRLGVRGWEWLFLLEGVPSIVLGFVTLKRLTDRPENAQWLPDGERAWLVNQLRQNHTAPHIAHDVAAVAGLKNPMVWLFGLTSFLMAMPLWAYAFWAPLFVREALFTTNVATGVIVACVSVVAGASTILSGIVSDQTGDRCLFAAGGAAVAMMGCLGAALLPNGMWRVVALAAIEIGVRTYVTPFLCLAPTLLRGRAAAAGIALVNTIFSVGGFVGPTLVGWFKEATGSANGAFLMLSALSLCAAVLCVAIRRHPAFGVTRARRSKVDP